MLLTRTQLLSVYKRLLLHAKHFPSIRREGLRETIREEFRDNVNISDSKKLEELHKYALFGIEHMQKYTSLDPEAHEWSVDLEKDPLGAAEYHERKETENAQKNKKSA